MAMAMSNHQRGNVLSPLFPAFNNHPLGEFFNKHRRARLFCGLRLRQPSPDIDQKVPRTMFQFLMKIGASLLTGDSPVMDVQLVLDP